MNCCVTAACLLFVLVSSVSAQTPARNVQQRIDVAAIRAQREGVALGTARNFYKKLRIAYERDPDSISPKELSRASLEWFKAEIAVARTQSEALEAVSQYTEREDIPFGKKTDDARP